jgi:uncharacterized BrkB/YihY/UPF0761 family membrane protein
MATMRSRTQARATAFSKHCQDWADRQPADSMQGVCIDAWKRYRAADGPLESALLTIYIFVAILPALLVMEGYLEDDPRALADNLVSHYDLSPTTANLVRGVLAQGQSHQLGAALFAIAGSLFFGINFGRVLQSVHVKAWELTLPPRRTDLVRYLLTLLGLYGLILLVLVQVSELSGSPGWVKFALAPGWWALLTLYFLWVKRMLTYKLVPRRHMLRAAALTSAGIIVIVIGSSYFMDLWVNLYAKDYGGLGVVMAIFFWIGFTSAVIVLCTSLSPALAGRHTIRHTKPDG